MVDSLAEFKAVKGDAVALEDLVPGSEAHLSGQPTRLSRLHKDARLLRGPLNHCKLMAKRKAELLIAKTMTTNCKQIFTTKGS